MAETRIQSTYKHKYQFYLEMLLGAVYEMLC